MPVIDLGPCGCCGSGGPCCHQYDGVVLTLTLHGPACLDGHQFTMTPTGPGTGGWNGPVFLICSMTGSNQLSVSCDSAGTWTLSAATSCIDSSCCFPTPGNFGNPGTVVSCSPLQVVWHVPVDSSCGGPATVTMTLTQ